MLEDELFHCHSYLNVSEELYFIEKAFQLIFSVLVKQISVLWVVG